MRSRRAAPSPRAANIGSYTRDEFSILVDTEGRIGIDITAGVQAYVGYNFLYLSEAVRPFNQVTPPAAAVAGELPPVPVSVAAIRRRA